MIKLGLCTCSLQNRIFIVVSRSVVLSLSLLPKLFCSFQQFNETSTYEVVDNANKKLNMMKLFFENLVYYCQQRTISPEMFYNHYEEVQARLQFLTSVYSTELSPSKFSEFAFFDFACFVVLFCMQQEFRCRLLWGRVRVTNVDGDSSSSLHSTGLTSHQVDLLWSSLVENDECCDDTLEWFVNQARNKDLHALDIPTFKYIFKEKVKDTVCLQMFFVV